MQFLIVVLFFCTVIFFFCLHVLAKEDLIFVRKNVTLESLFNLAFLTLFVGLFTSRVLFVASNPDPAYLNPLVFFLFPYFPGLSLVGGVIGGMIFLFLYSQRRKIPIGRIFDFFSLSFLASLPVGFFGTQVLLGMEDLFSAIVLPILYVGTLIFFIKVLLPLNIRGEIKDGSLGFVFLMIFSFSVFMTSFVRSENLNSFWTTPENILLLILFFFALFVLILLEKGGVRIKLQIRDR